MSANTRKFGPGIVVTAAFIGPGTITTASVVGADFGLALLWALLFSIGTTFVLQEMAARLGLVTRLGVSEALAKLITASWLRWSVLLLVVVAIGFGNAAYQTGNLLGAAIGASTLTGYGQTTLILVIAGLATLLLASGAYRLIESVLIFLVFAMSSVFVLAMLMNPPDLIDALHGFVPEIPDGSELAIIALVGTTVVPYNLFLYAHTVQERWSRDEDVTSSLSASRLDLGISVSIGGVITLSIISTAATAFFGSNIEVTGTTMASQLEPLLGNWATIFVASGLCAAGMTSAITAPLAAAYAVCGAFGLKTSLRAWPFRLVWLSVMIFGSGFALAETKPITAILIAQAANGILLPLIAILLVWVMNSSLLGSYKNKWASNLVGGVAILITLGLCLAKLA